MTFINVSYSYNFQGIFWYSRSVAIVLVILHGFASLSENLTLVIVCTINAKKFYIVIVSCKCSDTSLSTIFVYTKERLRL